MQINIGSQFKMNFMRKRGFWLQNFHSIKNRLARKSFLMKFVGYVWNFQLVLNINNFFVLEKKAYKLGIQIFSNLGIFRTILGYLQATHTLMEIVKLSIFTNNKSVIFQISWKSLVSFLKKITPKAVLCASFGSK